MSAHTSKSFAILGLLLSTACAPGGPTREGPAPGGQEARNVIVMIADGAGTAAWSAAELADGELAVRRMPVAGLVATRSASSRVTDSAAGATVYATGVRTYNGAIGVGPECGELLRRDSLALKRDPSLCEPLESVFDVARRRGMATGVVTTASVTDATPAAFVARSPRRYWQELIADQFARALPEVVLGGGRRYFDGSGREDGRDLLPALCERAACLSTAGELAGYRADERPLLGLFAADALPAAGERSPSLPQMVRAALARLERDPDGFVALFETEGTDNAGHANAPLEALAAEVLEFDAAVGEVLDFARRDGRTLVVVTADHETGGLSLVGEGSGVAARYSTHDHTAALVPLFAYGPGAERFAGLRRNEEVGRLLMRAVGGER